MKTDCDTWDKCHVTNDVLVVISIMFCDLMGDARVFLETVVFLFTMDDYLFQCRFMVVLDHSCAHEFYQGS